MQMIGMKGKYNFMMPDVATPSNTSFENRLNMLDELVKNAEHIVFFGGAGVSTESGIPDFRSKDGLYNQHNVQFNEYDPEDLLSRECLYNNPKVFYEFYRQKLDVRNIEPNVTHKWLAALENAGKKVTIITQNIDGLHQKAGSKNVLEIHGTTYENECSNSKCKEQFSGTYIFESKEAIPKCPCCNKGMVRPKITLYGENLPKAFKEANDVIADADLLIVAGTSLSVYPAANLVSEFKGEHLVVVNRDETFADNYADIVFREEMGQIFGQLSASNEYDFEI